MSNTKAMPSVVGGRDVESTRLGTGARQPLRPTKEAEGSGREALRAESDAVTPCRLLCRKPGLRPRGSCSGAWIARGGPAIFFPDRPSKG